MKAKRYLPILYLVLLWSLFNSCHNLGKEKVYDGVRLYHNPPVTDDDAEALGNYLVANKFSDGTEKTVQVNKNGDTYYFRVIKDEMTKDTNYQKNIKLFAAELSNDIFNHAPVEVDVCDKEMNTIKAFPYIDFGKKKLFDGVHLFYTNGIQQAQADSLGNYLIKSEFADGLTRTVQITKAGDVYQFRFVGGPGAATDQGILNSLASYASEISKVVFGGAPVEIQVCDLYMTTLATVQMSKKSTY